MRSARPRLVLRSAALRALHDEPILGPAPRSPARGLTGVQPVKVSRSGAARGGGVSDVWATNGQHPARSPREDCVGDGGGSNVRRLGRAHIPEWCSDVFSYRTRYVAPGALWPSRPPSRTRRHLPSIPDRCPCSTTRLRGAGAGGYGGQEPFRVRRLPCGFTPHLCALWQRALAVGYHLG